MTGYYRVMLGKGSAYIDECVGDGFIGADYDIRENLSGKPTADWRAFNKAYIPVFMTNVPGKSLLHQGVIG